MYIRAVGSDDQVTNYKFFVFSGKARWVQVESKTAEGHFRTFFDAEGERLWIRKWIGYLKTDQMPKPSGQWD
jgi:hypothetical protein